MFNKNFIYMRNEFQKYLTSHMGVSSTTLDDVKKFTEKHHNYQNFESVTLLDSMGNPIIKNSVTPTIIEERKLNVAAMSVFDRLMMDRIIWCAGPVDDRMSIVVQAQLLFLSDQDSKKTITMHIDSPGGSVKSGLSMVDVMNYIDAPIQTINTGMAASMGSVLLGAGEKGMRSSLRFSKTMLHQSSGGAMGNIQDARITMDEWEKTNKLLFELLGEYCDKDPKQVEEDATRDLWLSSEEALKYGIIDEIIGKK
jgi:ATP-dependent Clp protease protease subunit